MDARFLHDTVTARATIAGGVPVQLLSRSASRTEGEEGRRGGSR
jgi:hypothetical protein